MKNRKAPTPMKFAAKILFQFRVVAGGESNVMRTCEERIIVFDAPTARTTLAEAKKRGKKAQHRYKNDGGGLVHFEFVGVMDLLHLGAECEDDEVWYDITQRKLPWSGLPRSCRRRPNSTPCAMSSNRSVDTNTFAAKGAARRPLPQRAGHLHVSRHREKWLWQSFR